MTNNLQSDSDSDDSEDNMTLAAMRNKIKNVKENENDYKNNSSSPEISDDSSEFEENINDLRHMNHKESFTKDKQKEKICKEEKHILIESISIKKKKKETADFRQMDCSAALYDTAKGRFIQELLCRWWYAIDWPPKQSISEEIPEAQELDGFPGAYIVTKGEHMGKIIDTRPEEGKPTFLNLIKKKTSEIAELLIQAYKNQIKELVKHEGENTLLEDYLQEKLKRVERMNPSFYEKMEKEFLKIWVEWSPFIEKKFPSKKPKIDFFSKRHEADSKINIKKE